MRRADEDARALRCAIDVGTNTLLAVVGRVGDDGRVERIADWAAITRLGAGVDAHGSLAPDAMQRTLDALEKFVGDARALGANAFDAVATSAVRDARNRAEFLAAAHTRAGITIDAISGAREAELTFAGAADGTEISLDARVLVFDVGGGSTEMAAGRGCARADWTVSIDVGSVRLTERFVRRDPPTAGERASMREAIDALLPDECPAHDELLGLAATVTTLCAIRDGANDPVGARSHGARISRVDVERIAETLARMPLSERRCIAGLDPARADVIVAGSEIVCAVLRWSARESIVVSNGGVRVGLLREMCGR